MRVVLQQRGQDQPRFARPQRASVTGKRFMAFLLCGGRPPAKLRARAVPRPTRIVDPLLVTNFGETNEQRAVLAAFRSEA
jgi:hypothetical protein